MSNELYHHGILGQKWGVRRFQKEDGTRTPLGEKHRDMVDDSSKPSKIAGIDKDKIKKGALIAAGVLATGAAAYAIHKSGADQRALDKFKGSLPFEQGVKVAKAEYKVKKFLNPNYMTKREQALKVLEKEREEYNAKMAQKAAKRALEKRLDSARVKTAREAFLEKELESAKKTSMSATQKKPSPAVMAILEANQVAHMKQRVANGEAVMRRNGKNAVPNKVEQKLLIALDNKQLKDIRKAANAQIKLDNAALKFINFNDRLAKT